MSRQREAVAVFFAGLLLSAVAGTAARAVAQVQSDVSVDVLPHATAEALFRMLPSLLVAGACAHAAAFYSRSKVGAVLGLTLPGDIYWTYRGELGYQAAIHAKRWTAAALSGGFAWIASIITVMLAILAVFAVAAWRERRLARRAKSSKAPRAIRNRPFVATAVVDSGRAHGVANFACPECGGTVNWGASECAVCEQPFDYKKEPGNP